MPLGRKGETEENSRKTLSTRVTQRFEALAQPRTICDGQRPNASREVAEYRERGGGRLNAQGRPLGWIDVSSAKKLRKHKSIFSAYLSFGQAGQTLDDGGLAHTQLKDLRLGHWARVVDGHWATGSRST